MGTTTEKRILLGDHVSKTFPPVEALGEETAGMMIAILEMGAVTILIMILLKPHVSRAKNESPWVQKKKILNC
ncbi:MAG: hypothetical protein QXT02_03585 [Candidatus Hadarchaeum sp.]|uniref:hypothetical protein n=1 Tax=Candidatus Hadarchaeum sp. TaxID=2883567 RepID=UPI00317BF2A0